ncbi:MAG: UDP-3-O-(3-hydroxymyristoyl)glucosamine N-acyltransferase [Ekhidna sp.]|nr:UDP-3-O-(3-hydroxymyristoyl)glucosamine N-acyltransferase [Ekhidna sp.]
MKKYYIKDILPILKAGSFKILGEKPDTYFINIKTTLEGKSDSLVFISPDRNDKQGLLENTKAGIVIIDGSFEITDSIKNDKCILVVADPKKVFATIGNAIFCNHPPAFGVHPTAYIHPDAKINSKTYIGPFCYVGKVEIDEGTIIEGHCHLYDNTIIGKNVIIKAGAVIGGSGFGFMKDINNNEVNFPHVGGVIIEENVAIGSGNCIDRGALGNTIIRRNAKLDNLVHVAHNVVIGENTYLTASSTIAGSTSIGDDVFIGPNASVSSGLMIDSDAFITIGSVVTRNVEESSHITGNFAVPHTTFLNILKKNINEIEGK